MNELDRILGSNMNLNLSGFMKNKVKKKVVSKGNIKPYHANIEKQTLRNNNWRQTPFTGRSSQVVLMSINPGDSIENEIHRGVDQFFRIESGNAKFVLNNGRKVFTGSDGTAVVVPQGTWHQVFNTSKTKKLKLYTIYSPPNHPARTLQRVHPKND